jgi:hypothetical protein
MQAFQIKYPWKDTEDKVSNLGYYIRDKVLIGMPAVKTLQSSELKRGIVQSCSMPKSISCVFRDDKWELL